MQVRRDVPCRRAGLDKSQVHVIALGAAVAAPQDPRSSAHLCFPCFVHSVAVGFGQAWAFHGVDIQPVGSAFQAF